MKNIDTEITNYVVEHHFKELTERLLRLWEQECKSTEARAKDEFEKKGQWFKENWIVVKEIKSQKISHMKETMNLK